MICKRDLLRRPILAGLLLLGLTIPIPLRSSVEIARIAAYLTGASAVDKEGNLYFAGNTTSTNLPVSANAFQKNVMASTCGYGPAPRGTLGPPIPCNRAYVIKIDSTGTRVIYATYLGGGRRETASSIAVDNEGHAYVSGSTSSDDFPVTAGSFMTSRPAGASGSGFLTKLSPDGSSLVFSTLLPDPVAFTRLDESREIILVGSTNSATFPTTPGAFQSQRHIGHSDIFFMKMNATGSGLIFATLLGGTYVDVVNAFQMDGEGNVYLVLPHPPPRLPLA